MKTRKNIPTETAGTGSVLVLAVWTLLFLSVLSLAVGAHVSRNITLATSVQNRLAAYYAAKAGVETAIARISADTNLWDTLDEPWGDQNSDRLKEIGFGESLFSVMYLESGPEGGVVTNYCVRDEERRIDINSVTNSTGREMIRSLLELTGELTRDEAVRLVECIADWVDDDDDARKYGAEKIYYMGRSPRYGCRNAPVEFLEELLLVKGMSRELLSRVEPYLTAHGTPGSVNINTADAMVLASVAGAQPKADPDLCRALAERIVEYRTDTGGFADLKKRELQKQLFSDSAGMSVAERGEWKLLEWVINHHLLAVHSRHFYAISKGRTTHSPGADIAITFVFDREKGVIRAWNEQ